MWPGYRVLKHLISPSVKMSAHQSPRITDTQQYFDPIIRTRIAARLREHHLPPGARSYLRQTQQELYQTAREAHVYLGSLQRHCLPVKKHRLNRQASPFPVSNLLETMRMLHLTVFCNLNDSVIRIPTGALGRGEFIWDKNRKGMGGRSRPEPAPHRN